MYLYIHFNKLLHQFTVFLATYKEIRGDPRLLELECKDGTEAMRFINISLSAEVKYLPWGWISVCSNISYDLINNTRYLWMELHELLVGKWKYTQFPNIQDSIIKVSVSFIPKQYISWYINFMFYVGMEKWLLL